MRRIFNLTDDMNCCVQTYELDDGRRFQVDARYLRRYGMAELMRHMGVEVPKERLPVFQGGREIGSLPIWFDPLGVRSTSWLYEPRPGDFKRDGETWIADPMIGPGDLDAIPEFAWKSADYEAGRVGRKAEMGEVLLSALAAGSRRAETNEDLAQCEASQSGPKGNAQPLSAKSEEGSGK